MTRVEQVRAEIARRRELAQSVEHFESPWRMVYGDDGIGAVGYQCSDPDGGLVCETPDYGTWRLPDFIAAQDPAHVLAVLAAADVVLDRHVECGHRQCVDDRACDLCWKPWPCPDAAAVLDLYAPEVSGG